MILQKKFAIFSLSDLDGFAQMIQNSTASTLSYTLMVISAKGTFALKITNKTTFLTIVTALVNNWIMSESAFRFIVKQTMTPSEQAEGFLEFFKSNSDPAFKNTGFELYRADGPNFTEWKKLSLDSSNNIITTPC